ncbi:hypothetical protein MGG_17484 [Pyricularia oryzae 70-15]|uniref:Bulb-type lectin domain-containing protein n=2 Tax=Pyricularia oryzae TaxID=318829 RepID=G4ND92_PYRO7|nr:uncharacterized protein MGG_17484 [Pyricularia oryzae 70-15]EHA49230.1 hypothetical protein MGG_17484 [Pyricularia oryzae 70-15]ELQ37325.1 hypothetical protein OOU_Y34scaffold00608g92 [Pyricularia oryzae Y34]
MWSSGWAIWVAGRRAIPAGDGSNTNETYSTMGRLLVIMHRIKNGAKCRPKVDRHVQST